MAGPCDSEQKFSFHGTPPSTWKSVAFYASVLWTQLDDVFLSRADGSQQKQHQSKFMSLLLPCIYFLFLLINRQSITDGWAIFFSSM